MRIQDFWGMLLIFGQPVLGLLIQDPVVCKFIEMDQCYVAEGQRLHLSIPQEEKFTLKLTQGPDIFGILRYTRDKFVFLSPNLPTEQFVTDNMTFIVNSAEKNISGNYSLETFESNGKFKGRYFLQLNIEARVSSVEILQNCLSPGVMKVSCSAHGDDLSYELTGDYNTPLRNGTHTVELDRNYQGNVTCHVENRVSRGHTSRQLSPCLGLLIKDPVVCKFIEIDQCYVAEGQRLHLLIPQEEKFNLKLIEGPDVFAILRYTKNSQIILSPNLPTGQFVTDNMTLIVNSAEKNISGNYSLETFDSGGKFKGRYFLQLNIEAQVSSVKVSYSCLSSGLQKVDCSADGDDLHFSWTSEINPANQQVDGRSSWLLEEAQENLTCHVRNHVSSAQRSIQVQSCYETFIQSNTGFKVFVSVWFFEIIILLSLLVGAFYIYTRIYRKITTKNNHLQI